MAEIWDLEDEVNREKVVPTCQEIAQQPAPYFKRVFKNNVYHVLEVVKAPTVNQSW